MAEFIDGVPTQCFRQAAILPTGLVESQRIMTSGTLREVTTLANQWTTSFWPSHHGWPVKRAVEKLLLQMNPKQVVQTGGIFSIAAATQAFLSLNVSTIVASGSATAVGVASAFAVGAAAAGYGVGTLINNTFNLSDQIGDGLYKFFRG